jgi:hypothetical protein
MAAMDTRWQPPLHHPAAPDGAGPEARGLFAAGWCAGREECRLVHPGLGEEQLVAPEVWRALRALTDQVPVHLLAQAP